jgi:hypothetical protein
MSDKPVNSIACRLSLRRPLAEQLDRPLTKRGRGQR